jgi:hypothetical protein
MATILDVGLLEFFTPIFVFVLVFSLVYALLSKTKMLSESAGVNGTIAVIIGLLLLIVPEAREVITIFTPWFTLFIILVIFIFLFFMALGVKEKSLLHVATQNNAFITFAIAIIVIIFLIALSKAFGPFLLVNGEPGFWNAVKRTVFHPKALGALLLLLIASYTVGFLSQNK